MSCFWTGETGIGRHSKRFSPLYYELQRLARQQLRRQRPNHTLQTTGLVHEAFLRLAEQNSLHIKDRAHFLGIAAQLMRWILVDYERSRRAAKREPALHGCLSIPASAKLVRKVTTLT